MPAAQADTDKGRELLDHRVLQDILGLDEAHYEGVRRLARALSNEPVIAGR